MKCNIISETCVDNYQLDDQINEQLKTSDFLKIPQYDGNDTLNESILSEHQSAFSSSIPVIVSLRPSLIADGRRPCFNKTLIRDNKLIDALNLPIFTVYNMRSIWLKINNLAKDIIERSVDISFLSEVWEKKENMKHQSKIEELLELKGISYISTPRPGLKRGGGSAIAACPKKFSLVKLNIEIPKCLEVVWGLLRPRKVLGKLRKIIICSFYSPPRSKKKSILIDHILTVLNQLRTEHPGAATIVAGDKNDLDESAILAFDPALIQSVKKPTRKDSLLSIIITDLHRFYVEPKIVDPIPVDKPGKGAPSDHNDVLAVPLSTKQSQKNTSKEIRFVRPMPESSIVEFSRSISSIDWSLMLDGSSSSEMVSVFQKMVSDLQDIHFPLKKISITRYDKAWMTEELKKLRRRRQRIYRKEGRSLNYLEIKNEFDKLMKVEVEKYVSKIHDEVSNGKRGTSYSAIRRLGDRNFALSKGSESFEIPEFINDNLDDQQSAEALADYFSTISQEFDPLSIDDFPPNVKNELEKGKTSVNVPVLNELQVYQKIVRAKKPHSTVPGDLKRVLVKECPGELVTPITKIYNRITQSKEFPRSWVNEQQTPIPKTHPPASLEDIRNISGTPFFSKQYESFLSDWLLPIVDPYLDPG